MRQSVSGLNQAKLIEFGLDVTDALILRCYINYLPTMEVFWDNGCGCRILNAQQLLESLPILGAKHTIIITKRFNKYIAAGIMIKHVIDMHEKITAISLTNKFVELLGE